MTELERFAHDLFFHRGWRWALAGVPVFVAMAIIFGASGEGDIAAILGLIAAGHLVYGWVDLTRERNGRSAREGKP